jgi:hypothetical protein
VQNKAKRLKIKGVYKMKLFKSAFSLLLLAGCVQNLPSIGPDYKEELLCGMICPTILTFL